MSDFRGIGLPPGTVDTDTGITQLTGDATAGPGNGSQAVTLATVNSNVGSFTTANITVNAKGLVTAAASGTGGGGATSGFQVQKTFTLFSAVNVGTTAMSYADGIPINTDGTQFMHHTFVPLGSSNILHIQMTAMFSTAGNNKIVHCLFQDSVTNGIAAMSTTTTAANDTNCTTFSHFMTAGTTSAIVFKYRAGTNAGTTMTFNGQAGAREMGGIMASSIVISETKAP